LRIALQFFPHSNPCCEISKHSSTGDRNTVGPVASAYQEPLRRSLDHLVGTGEQRRRHFQANRLRHDQVNDEVELGRLLDRKIGGFRPSKILSTKSAGAPLRSMKDCYFS